MYVWVFSIFSCIPISIPTHTYTQASTYYSYLYTNFHVQLYILVYTHIYIYKCITEAQTEFSYWLLYTSYLLISKKHLSQNPITSHLIQFYLEPQHSFYHYQRYHHHSILANISYICVYLCASTILVCEVLFNIKCREVPTIPT